MLATRIYIQVEHHRLPQTMTGTWSDSSERSVLIAISYSSSGPSDERGRSNEYTSMAKPPKEKLRMAIFQRLIRLIGHVRLAGCDLQGHRGVVRSDEPPWYSASNVWLVDCGRC